MNAIRLLLDWFFFVLLSCFTKFFLTSFFFIGHSWNKRRQKRTFPGSFTVTPLFFFVYNLLGPRFLLKYLLCVCFSLFIWWWRGLQTVACLSLDENNSIRCLSVERRRNIWYRPWDLRRFFLYLFLWLIFAKAKCLRYMLATNDCASLDRQKETHQNGWRYPPKDTNENSNNIKSRIVFLLKWRLGQQWLLPYWHWYDIGHLMGSLFHLQWTVNTSFSLLLETYLLHFIHSSFTIPFSHLSIFITF